MKHTTDMERNASIIILSLAGETLLEVSVTAASSEPESLSVGSLRAQLAQKTGHGYYVLQLLHGTTPLQDEVLVASLYPIAVDQHDLFLTAVVESYDPNLTDQVVDASYMGNSDTVDLLLQTHGDPNADMTGEPLCAASSFGHLKIVELLVRAGATVAQTKPYKTPFYEASKNGHLDVVEILHAHNADINQWSPICTAASNGHLSVVHFLCNVKADIDSIHGISGCTPLISAACGGHFEVIRCLLEARASVNAVDGNRATAAYYSSGRGELETLMLLYEYNADLCMSAADGSTPLLEASTGGHASVIACLSHLRADMEATTNCGSAFPLFQAVRSCNARAVEVLCLAGADVTRRTRSGVSLEAVATNQGCRSMAYILQWFSNLSGSTQP